MANEGDRLALEALFDDCHELVAQDALEVVRSPCTRSAWPFWTSSRSPFVSVSASTIATTTSLMAVFAFVGPRPVYSRSSCTAAVEMTAPCLPSRFCDSDRLSRGPKLRVTAATGPWKGPPMSGTQPGLAWSSHRDAVAVLVEAGEPFGEVERSIDALAELSTDQKAALWLFAFSLRDPGADELDALASR